jgi:hypothetical protein
LIHTKLKGAERIAPRPILRVLAFPFWRKASV